MYAYIDSFRKFGKTNTDNQSIKIKRPYPEGRGSLYGVVDCFCGKYSLRVTNRDLLFP